MSELLTPELCQAVVEEVADLAMDKYVYPDVGEQLAGTIRAKLERGDYDGITEAGELAAVLTVDLTAASNDRHWSVIYDPNLSAAQVDPEEEEDDAALERWLADARRRNFGFWRVEHLRGNVAYLDLREFAPAQHAGSTAVAAMALVAQCDALIFDLRKNHGGFPSMVQLLTSYLFDTEPVHLNTIYYRPSNEYRQFWTLPHVPGARLPDVPVYVLTSRATGSGAEEFANNLKQMGRATLIGETTIGAAHPVTKEVVQEHFQVRLPYGRPINPISGEDWEGTGIEPHVAVPEEQALEVAHVRALAQLTESCPDEGRRRDLLWDAEIVESQYTPIEVGEATLARCAGQYGPRGFAVQGGALAYTHELAGATYELTAMTESRFRLNDDVKFEFVIGEQGPASAVHVAYRDGRPDVTSPRTA